MPELAQAWVTLTANTKGMESDVRRSLGRVDGAGAGRKVGEQFSGSFSASAERGIGRANSAIRSSLNEMVSGITSQFGRAGKSVDSVFQSIPSKAALGAGAVIGIGAAAVTVGKQLYDLGAQWDDVVDTAAGRTGLLGDKLKDLTGSIKDVANVTASSIPEIGDIASRVAQSLHITGQPLQDMTKTIADLNALTGEQLNVRELGKAYRAFGVDVGDQVPQLDALWHASTATGIPINELVATVVKGGSALREFGLDLGESAALVATFEDAGLDADGAVNGLRIALKNFAAAGKEPQQALRDTITEIKNLSDAGNTAAAVDLAAKTFGKGFAPFLDSIKSGKVDVDSLNQSLRQIGPSAAPSIQQARKETSDWQEQLTILKNSLSTELEPAASLAFSGINNLLEQSVIRPFREANDIVTAFKNSLAGVTMPSGSAVLGPDGKPVAAPAPRPAANPLDVLKNPPTSSNTGGPQNPLDVFFPRRSSGGSIFGPGNGTSDSIPAWLSNGEHVLTADEVNRMGGQGAVYAFRNALHRQGGGFIPLRDPRGIDPHGGSDRGSSLGPFAPWWDMDWIPPEHPERIGPSIPGVEGKWWHRGPAGKGKFGGGSGPWAPPIGKLRPPLPGDPWLLPDDRIKIWGFAGGGAVLTRDNLDQIATSKFGLTLGSGDRAEPGSYHNLHGGARDYNGPPDRLEAFANWVADNLGPYVDELIFDSPTFGKTIKDGTLKGPFGAFYTLGQAGKHSDHVHVAFGKRAASYTGAASSATTGVGSLSRSSGKDDVASAIIAEAGNRGFNREQTIAALSTGLQESGLSPTIQGGGGAWHGIFQQDSSYPGRDDPNTNISTFFDRLGPPTGDIWSQIFKLQQGTALDSPNARKGFLSEIQSKTGEATTLYDSLANATTPTDTGAEIVRHYAEGLNEGGQDAAQRLKDQSGSSASGGGMDGSSLGQSIFSGILQGMGFDGSVFSNPFEWPNVKSGIALANFGGGLLKGVMARDQAAPIGGGGGPSIGGLNLPNITDFIKPSGPGALTPNAPPPGTSASGIGAGPAPGPTIINNGTIGMDPRGLTQRLDTAQNQAWRRNMTSVRPGG